MQDDPKDLQGNTGLLGSPEPLLAPLAAPSQEWPASPKRRRSTRRDAIPDSRSPSQSRPSSITSEREGWELRVKLKPLDDQQEEFKVAVEEGSSVSSLECRVRERCHQGDQPLEEGALIQLYDSNGEQLALDASLDTTTTEMWYRVAASWHSSSADWRLSRWDDLDDRPLEETLAAKMVAAIDGGATVAEVKQVVATHMGIQDANRVVLVAREGMRRGSLQGSAWRVSRVKKWLCRWLSIDVTPEHGYVVLRGMKREFVYNPDPADLCGEMPLRLMLRYLDTRVFRGAHRYAKSELSPRSQISLWLNKEAVSPVDTVSWGETYEFEITDHNLADAYALEESWLLPRTETCSVCDEPKTLGEVPLSITARCGHEATTCRNCLNRWLQYSLEDNTWDTLRCPECPELLAWHDVRRLALETTFERYDELAARAAFKEDPNFHFCPAPGCESGQVVPESCLRFLCVSCGTISCLRHNVPWHQGESCEQYDQRNRRRVKQEKASEKEIRRTTRACPNCKRPVYKYTGCNHITCICGFEWCYSCLAPFEPNSVGTPLCMHLPRCREGNPFAFDPMPDPPPLRRPTPGRRPAGLRLLFRVPLLPQQILAAGISAINRLVHLVWGDDDEVGGGNGGRRVGRQHLRQRARQPGDEQLQQQQDQQQQQQQHHHHHHHHQRRRQHRHPSPAPAPAAEELLWLDGGDQLTHVFRGRRLRGPDILRLPHNHVGGGRGDGGSGIGRDLLPAPEQWRQLIWHDDPELDVSYI